jgi:hypothetical protein
VPFIHQLYHTHLICQVNKRITQINISINFQIPKIESIPKIIIKRNQAS